MTVILAYSNIKGSDSLGILAADNLVRNTDKPGNSGDYNGDKLSKINNRFTIGVVGLQAVDYMLSYCFPYYGQFDSLRPFINSIEELAGYLNQWFTYGFPKFKSRNLLNSNASWSGMHSELIVLDCYTNELYYTNLGSVWEDGHIFNINFKKLPSCKLFLFGAPVLDKTLGFESEDHDTMDRIEVYDMINSRIEFYHTHPVSASVVGSLGSLQINALGSKEYSYFSSSFKSIKDFIDTLVAAMQT